MIEYFFSDLFCRSSVYLNKELQNGREMNLAENCAVVHWLLDRQLQIIV